MCVLSANYKETCEKLTENTAFTQLKHNIKLVGLYENTSQLHFHPDLMVYFLFTTLLKLVASSFSFFIQKYYAYTEPSITADSMFKISTLNSWKIRIKQEILEEIYSSNSVTEFSFCI